jgi:small subunit ribosomal protein S3
LGQKVHPLGFRLGINKTWKSRWYADKTYGQLLHEDLKLRRFIKQRLFHAGISRIEIERTAERVRIFIHTARPGIIIGKKGAEVDKLKNDLMGITSKEIQLEIVEVRKAELDAQLVAEQVASQLERRVAFRRAMKKAVTSALRLGAKGVRIACAGRLAGAEIARREWYREGRVPLHTLRADIDFGYAESLTTYGLIGVKAWIYHGEILPEGAASKEPSTRGARDSEETREGARRGRREG